VVAGKIQNTISKLQPEDKSSNEVRYSFEMIHERVGSILYCSPDGFGVQRINTESSKVFVDFSSG
jgi:hypothetical protein